MAEQRFLRSQRSAAAQPLAPNPNRTGIQINWREGVVKTIKTRHHHIEMATKVCCINPAGAGSGCRQGHDAQPALNTEAQKDFRLKARKAGDLKIQPGPRIRSSALVVLAVLSLCLSPFAQGQEPAVGFTR